MDVQRLIYSIIDFLKSQYEKGTLTTEAKEGVEVAMQCLQAAYITCEDPASLEVPMPLLDIFNNYLAEHPELTMVEATPEQKEQASAHKTEGNNHMTSHEYTDAVACYTKAIQLDPKNAVYYCNRAAASNKLGNFQSAVQDCNAALKIDPNYSKAYGRLGLAYASMRKHKEAVESYRKALALEPTNESYKSNLQLAEEAVASGAAPANPGSGPNPVDLGVIFSNPTLINMATQMLSNPQMQNIMSSIIGNVGAEAQGVDVLLEASQQLAQQMERDSPGLVQQLRQTMGDKDQPPQNQPPPSPPQ